MPSPFRSSLRIPTSAELDESNRQRLAAGRVPFEPRHDAELLIELGSSDLSDFERWITHPDERVALSALGWIGDFTRHSFDVPDLGALLRLAVDQADAEGRAWTPTLAAAVRPLVWCEIDCDTYQVPRHPEIGVPADRLGPVATWLAGASEAEARALMDLPAPGPEFVARHAGTEALGTDLLKELAEAKLFAELAANPNLSSAQLQWITVTMFRRFRRELPDEAPYIEMAKRFEVVPDPMFRAIHGDECLHAAGRRAVPPLLRFPLSPEQLRSLSEELPRSSTEIHNWRRLCLHPNCPTELWITALDGMAYMNFDLLESLSYDERALTRPELLGMARDGEDAITIANFLELMDEPEQVDIAQRLARSIDTERILAWVDYRTRARRSLPSCVLTTLLAHGAQDLRVELILRIPDLHAPASEQPASPPTRRPAMARS